MESRNNNFSFAFWGSHLIFQMFLFQFMNPNGSKELPNGSKELPNGSKELPNGSKELPNESKELPNDSKELPNPNPKIPPLINLFSLLNLGSQ
jgi:hypothetical protein